MIPVRMAWFGLLRNRWSVRCQCARCFDYFTVGEVAAVSYSEAKVNARIKFGTKPWCDTCLRFAREHGSSRGYRGPASHHGAQ